MCIRDRVKSGKTAELEIFVHTAETSLFSAIGHVDICYQGRVISYGNYDPSSETLFGMVDVYKRQHLYENTS